MAAAAFAADQVEMSVSPVYGNMAFQNSATPMTVKLYNDGPAADVTIDVRGSKSEIVYRTTVGAKTTKTITTYPLAVVDGMYGVPPGGFKFTFDMKALPAGAKKGATPVANIHYVTAEMRSAVVEPLLLIADAGPTAKYLREAIKDTGKRPPAAITKSWMELPLDVSSLKPKAALDRWLGYIGFRAVLLGTGTRRLSDQTIEALKHYVIGGGEVVIGQEPESAIDDPRWADMLPSTPQQAHQGFGTVVRLASALTSSTAENPELAISVRRAIYLPDEGRFRLTSLLGEPTTQGWDPLTAKAEGDPFSARLPSLPKMVVVLLAYFLAVVPLNALLLRKLKRPELTWITAPAFAVVFAGLLFGSAKSLYATPASQYTQGTLVCQAGQPSSVFVGQTNMFFPSARTFALPLKNADLLMVKVGEGESPEVETDTGTFGVPSFYTESLAYRDASYSQILPYGDWFKFRSYTGGDGLNRIEVRNDGPMTVEHANLVAGVDHSLPCTLAPGSTLSMVVDKLRTRHHDVTVNGASSEAVYQGRVALTGKIHQDDLSIRVGKELASRSNVQLAAFAPNDLELR